MSLWHGLSKHYVAAAMTYGFGRKVLQLRDAHFTVWDDQKKAKVHAPVLFADKLALVTFGAMAGISIWPLYLYRDVQAIEIFLRPDVRKEWYMGKETPTSIADYMFS